MGNFTDNILPSLVANLIFFILGLGREKLSHYLKNKHSKYSKITFLALAFVWLVMNSYFIKLALTKPDWEYPSLIFFIISSTILFYLIYQDLRQFWDVGIIGADKKIIEGIDYDKSLKLCHEKLSFLGVGASKLTRSKEFDSALLRCRSDKTIRFLLFNPTSDHLISAAKRADKDQDRYHKIVVESLGKIAHLKNSRCENIEVRFYESKPIFRLMFIDDSLCLMGNYSNFGGVGDGSGFPQLHIKNMPETNYGSSFYRSLEIYFDELWNSSRRWDFEEHVG